MHQAAMEKLQAIDADYKARVESLTPEQMAKLRRIEAICREAAALPAVDTRSPEEIVAYDDKGVW